MIGFQTFSQETVSQLLEKSKLLEKNIPSRISVYYEILALDSLNYEALLGMGEAYYSRWKILGRIDKVYLDSALILFNKACNTQHPDYKSFLARGNYFYDFHCMDNAFEDFSHVLEEKKDLAHVYWQRGIIYLRRNDFENAITDFTTAINICPIENPFLYRMRSTCYYKLEIYGKCKSDIDKALKVAPNDNDNILYLGDFYAITGEYMKALKKYNFILSRNDKYSIAYLKRGNIYAAMKNIEKAEVDWNIAMRNGIKVSESRKKIFFGLD